LNKRLLHCGNVRRIRRLAVFREYRFSQLLLGVRWELCVLGCGRVVNRVRVAWRTNRHFDYDGGNDQHHDGDEAVEGWFSS
jgi:hypothetical protein